MGRGTSGGRRAVVPREARYQASAAGASRTAAAKRIQEGAVSEGPWVETALGPSVVAPGPRSLTLLVRARHSGNDVDVVADAVLYRPVALPFSPSGCCPTEGEGYASTASCLARATAARDGGAVALACVPAVDPGKDCVPDSSAEAIRVANLGGGRCLSAAARRVRLFLENP